MIRLIAVAETLKQATSDLHQVAEDMKRGGWPGVTVQPPASRDAAEEDER